MLKELCLDQNFDIDNYEMKKIMNDRPFDSSFIRAETYEAKNKRTNEEVIIQEVCILEREKMFKDLEKFYLLHHQAFVNILNLQLLRDKLIIVFEKMKNGQLTQPLLEYLKSKDNKNEKLNPTIRNKIIYGVASAVNFCQEKNIPFKNLDPSHVYLDENFEPHISIGVSVDLYLNPFMLCMGEYRIFQPPEYLDDNIKGEKYSVYQFGVFLYCMFWKQNFLYKREIKQHNSIPDVFWNLIKQCTKENPKDRPTIKEVFNDLKDDKYLLNEFGMKSDPEEVHQYQKKIEDNESMHYQFSSLLAKMHQ